MKKFLLVIVLLIVGTTSGCVEYIAASALETGLYYGVGSAIYGGADEKLKDPAATPPAAPVIGSAARGDTSPNNYQTRETVTVKDTKDIMARCEHFAVQKGCKFQKLSPQMVMLNWGNTAANQVIITVNIVSDTTLEVSIRTICFGQPAEPEAQARLKEFKEGIGI